ncbi:hypothetical protein ABB37_05917 [Leptomonas pyrrhocoris]|uniref:Uncharacterized protein n=1 Tax=Leptomonas pyrrhocoris TaxID=157538 RepID=A0A0M9FYN6_LEPPY|nr:hypothetical protein ABB37_05917 [Leptomonas pyrrhocoris]KPA78830.1 hypothetical protein ABB37_05917 [Leptomonas pyrrhocoris]|eukprot:XP_015657269.1 hypothetical protein ABB37_05917 [Leptomonas pyrrhocoris]
MAEKAMKKKLVLPPPIHRLYRFLGETQHRALHLSSQRHPAVASMASPAPTPSPTSNEESATPPQGDVYDFTFSRREAVQLRTRQRRYLRQQYASPHAPQLVHLEDVADTLLHECEINGSRTNVDNGEGEEEEEDEHDGYIRSAFDPAMTTSERVSELLAVFCTRGTPQDEFISAVFHFRLAVLQKTCKAVPIGVVVPSLVRPVVGLNDAVLTRRSRRDAAMAQAADSEADAEPKVTYPHPGTPFTFEDLARDPVQLSAERRLERRTALLHRRTLSEDLYGTPTPYL